MAALGRLLAGVAHELAAPVGTVLSNADSNARLVDKLETALNDGRIDKARQLLTEVRALSRVSNIACTRIIATVRAVKTAARAGELEVQLASVNDIAAAMLELAKTQFGHQVSAETDFGELPLIECYPPLLAQVFLNLLTNAGQAIGCAGKVTLGTRQDGDCVHIWVSDTGCGIPEEVKSKILQSGFTTKPVGVGTGLGLAIVHRIVTLHGGAVAFESKPGSGTTFHVRLPVRQKCKGV